MAVDKKIKNGLRYCKLAFKQFTKNGCEDHLIIYDDTFEGRIRASKALKRKLTHNDILFVNGLKMAKRDGQLKYLIEDWFD